MPDLQDRPQSADQAMAAALRHYRAGNPRAAGRLCERLLAVRPDHGPARHLLAITLLESGALARGIDQLRRLLADHPGNAEAWYGLGKALALTGRRAEAADALERAVDLAPRNIEAHLELAALHVEAGRADVATTLLRGALATAPTHPGLLNNLGSLLAQTGDPAEGVGLLERALALQDATPVTHYNLANALKQAGEAERAVDHYRAATRLKPDFVQAWHNLGNLLIDLGRIDAAAEAYYAAVKAKRRPGGPDAPLDTFRKTGPSKLAHDIEQFRYLMARGVLPEDFKGTLEAYEAALDRLPEPPADSHVVELPAALRGRLAPTYNRLVHWEPPPALSGPAVNPALAKGAIEADYARNAPGITHVDGFLTDPALAALRRFCLDSTIWYEFRYANGYLGAFMDDGFCCPLLLQIAEELRLALPGIFGAHRLRKLWAFKYDSRLSGIPIHADFAAVNVNFWITPDDANLDPESGGLVVWDKEAPLDWDFETYNADEPAMRGFLEETGARPINVAHRQNRVVIFNSDLFHETGQLRFRPGYENRRINITMLYGKRDA